MKSKAKKIVFSLKQDGLRSTINMILVHIEWRTVRLLNSVIPFSEIGDKIMAYISFLHCHRRFPRRSMTFNDVLFRIKTSGELSDPLRVFVTDKEFVKLFVKAVVGEKYNVPTIAVIHDLDELSRFEFAPICVIKSTHACGHVLIRTNGEQIDLDRIAGWLDINYYRDGRESNYKTLHPKIIVEPLLFGNSNLEDFKFFCYNGAPKIVQVHIDRYVNHKQKIFDAGWNELDFSINYPRFEGSVSRPDNLTEMLSVASRLSSYFSFVRVDLYSDGKACFVGEITNCSDNAHSHFIPSNAEYEVSMRIFR